MKYEIEKNKWSTCKICNESIVNLAKKYGGSNTYYTKVFAKHLEIDHQLSITDYFIRYDKQKICCENCNKKCDVSKPTGSKFYWKNMCGYNNGIKKWSEDAKTTRKGKNNPMYGKIPWNFGLNKVTSEGMKSVSEKMSNRIISDATKEKQSKSAKVRKIHGHTGKKHSEETKAKLSKNTLSLIERGVFKQTKSKPHIKFKNLLEQLNINFLEEKILGFWTFDFYLTEYDIYIEVDGDYFHSNPNTRWPNGPVTKTQIKVRANDNRKNKFAENNNIKLFRFWEYDILNNENEVLERIKCIVQKLNQ